MKLTNKQAMVLLDIAKASLSLAGGWGGYSHDEIGAIVNQIINQQSDTLVELNIEEKV